MKRLSEKKIVSKSTLAGLCVVKTSTDLLGLPVNTYVAVKPFGRDVMNLRLPIVITERLFEMRLTSVGFVNFQFDDVVSLENIHGEIVRTYPTDTIEFVGQVVGVFENDNCLHLKEIRQNA